MIIVIGSLAEGLLIRDLFACGGLAYLYEGDDLKDHLLPALMQITRIMTAYGEQISTWHTSESAMDAAGFTDENAFVPIIALLPPEITVRVTQADGLTARLRLYNGSAAPMTFAPDDISLTLGYAPNPPGPRLPDQAADLTLVWAWNGEPFGVLHGVWGLRFVLVRKFRFAFGGFRNQRPENRDQGYSLDRTQRNPKLKYLL